MADRIIRRYTVVTTVETYEEYVEISPSEESNQEIIIRQTNQGPSTPAQEIIRPMALATIAEHHEAVGEKMKKEKPDKRKKKKSGMNFGKKSQQSQHHQKVLAQKKKKDKNISKEDQEGVVKMDESLSDKRSPKKSLTILECVLCEFSATSEEQLENHIRLSHEDIFYTVETPTTPPVASTSTDAVEQEKPKSSATSLKRRHKTDDSETDLSGPSDVDSDSDWSLSSLSDSEKQEVLKKVNPSLQRKRCRTDDETQPKPTRQVKKLESRLLNSDDEEIIEVGRVQRTSTAQLSNSHDEEIIEVGRIQRIPPMSPGAKK